MLGNESQNPLENLSGNPAENAGNNQENKQEAMPTPEEIQEAFDKIIGPDAMRCEVETRENEEGVVYYRDISTKGPDGSITTYNYMAPHGHDGAAGCKQASIHYVVEYPDDPIPGGGSSAEFENGTWVYYGKKK